MRRFLRILKRGSRILTGLIIPYSCVKRLKQAYEQGATKTVRPAFVLSQASLTNLTLSADSHLLLQIDMWEERHVW